ncbi:MAG TPA: zinc ribbon domain-containing protein [Deltaproteobacteria bacterium]|jgi:putative FmdB family regulatory protein|nr:zinc ribbon domain-containing protein [Deltaproteobacteria bacterium]HOI07508.1 zinc ribbon domain-containing protein [Deltaproteobacteria bacterium]
MPIYEYQCRDCGEEFEKLVPMSAREPDCPRCGKGNVKKKISRVASGKSGCGSCASSSCSSCSPSHS